MRANLNETPTGEETFLTLRHIARSFEPEPEPVTLTVIGIVNIVDERKIHVHRPLRKPLKPGNGNGNGLGLGTTRTELMISSLRCECSLS